MSVSGQFVISFLDMCRHSSVFVEQDDSRNLQWVVRSDKFHGGAARNAFIEAEIDETKTNLSKSDFISLRCVITTIFVSLSIDVIKRTLENLKSSFANILILWPVLVLLLSVVQNPCSWKASSECHRQESEMRNIMSDRMEADETYSSGKAYCLNHLQSTEDIFI